MPTLGARGQAYQLRGDKGDQESAIADFDKAIELDPNLADAYVGLGRSYLFAGNHDKAIANLTQAIQLKSDDFDTHHVYFLRGLAYVSKGDMKRAEADPAKAEALEKVLKNVRKKEGNKQLLAFNKTQSRKGVKLQKKENERTGFRFPLRQGRGGSLLSLSPDETVNPRCRKHFLGRTTESELAPPQAGDAGRCDFALNSGKSPYRLIAKKEPKKD